MANDLNVAGAVAFSRTGDPDIGEFKKPDAVVIVKFGDVPEDLGGL